MLYVVSVYFVYSTILDTPMKDRQCDFIICRYNKTGVENLPSCAASFTQTPAQHLPIASI
jgi:hypothetical protein